MQAGGCARLERAANPRTYYRFQKPSDPAYPYMLELFFRQPDGINVPPGTHLAPISSDSDLSSLSAILLDDTYYRWVMAGRRQTDGLATVGPEHLIPLKARTYLDLRARPERNELVKGTHLRKHRNDVVRLAQLLGPTPIMEVPAVARRPPRLLSRPQPRH